MRELSLQAISMTNRIEQELNEFDFDKSSVEEIEKHFSNKILVHKRPTINISPDGLFRARIINKYSRKGFRDCKGYLVSQFQRN